MRAFCAKNAMSIVQCYFKVRIPFLKVGMHGMMTPLLTSYELLRRIALITRGTKRWGAVALFFPGNHLISLFKLKRLMIVLHVMYLLYVLVKKHTKCQMELCFA